VFVLVASACSSNDPSTRGPVDLGLLVPSTTFAPLSDVSGDWVANVTYRDPDGWCGCCDPDSRRATATLSQTGSDVTGSIDNACFEERLTGSLHTGTFTGTATVTDGEREYVGQVSGQANTLGFVLNTGELDSDGTRIAGFVVLLSR